MSDEDLEESLAAWDRADRLTEGGCAFPGKCLCPHVEHEHWECFTIEDAESREEDQA